MTATALTTDHPGWIHSDDNTRARVMDAGPGVWLARWTCAGLALSCIDGSEDDKPSAEETTAGQLPKAVPAELAGALTHLGTVVRIPNPSLWDALTTAILRQVVRAAQARVLYRRWCTAYGRTISTPAGPLALAPDPEAVLSLTDAAFKDVGAAFHRTALQAAASAYLEHHEKWAAMDAPELVSALDYIPRIGPWTASATTADYTGDFSVYPHGDLAVRTWADRAAPGVVWPATERAFATSWTAQADNNQQLHALTLLTLTWGSHVSTDHRRGSTQPL
ncbi:hypothetical protein [Streptomyces sp. SYSU K217416]